jgi:hypothetical protein
MGQKDQSYRVVFNQGIHPKCMCHKPHNTSITCYYVLAVCTIQNYDPNKFTNLIYKVDALMSTWGGHFEIFGREED